MHDRCLTAQHVMRCWLVAAKRSLVPTSPALFISPPHRIAACAACRWVAAAAAAAAAAWAAPCLAPSLMQVGWRSLAVADGKAALAAQGRISCPRPVGFVHTLFSLLSHGLWPPDAPSATRFAGGTVREYFDLDAPQNNRAVLDYGDL